MRHSRFGTVLPQLLLAAALAILPATPAAFGHDGPDYILTASETISEAQAILLADGYLSPFTPGGVKDVFPFLVMVVILWFKPYGLWGWIRIERV